MKKLIILGSGSSVDFGFPIGIKLSKDIHELWRHPNDEYINFLLKCLKKDKKNFKSFNQREAAVTRTKRLADRFYYSGADSIDDFLSRGLEDFETSFGKLTIINHILKKEKESKNKEPSESLFKWEDNWLRLLFGHEFRFKTVDELKKKLEQSPIKFITFNYDRSLEFFIFTAIKNYYDPKDDQLIDIFNKIEFYHVYGKLAPFSWEKKDANNSLKFGDDLKDSLDKSEELYRCASNIKVVNEERNNFDSIRNKCKKWIEDSNKVYILGFGFLESNYELLNIEGYKQTRQRNEIQSNKFFYTTYGLSESKKEDIRKKFGIIMGKSCRAESRDSTIYEYMRHFY